MIFYFLSKKLSTKFNSVFMKLKNNTKWWALVFAIFDVNMIRISYLCSTQINFPFFFDIYDKFNFTFTILIFFIIISYSLIFYGFVYSI